MVAAIVGHSLQRWGSAHALETWSSPAASASEIAPASEEMPNASARGTENRSGI